MVHISDGNSDIGAHLGSNLCYLICLRRLNPLIEFCSPKRPIFLYARLQHVWSYHLIQVPCLSQTKMEVRILGADWVLRFYLVIFKGKRFEEKDIVVSTKERYKHQDEQKLSNEI